MRRKHIAKKIIIAPECNISLDKAVEYIAENSPKQAEIMKEQFRETLKTIERMPTMGMPYKNGMRKMKLGKFKQYVYYREKEDFIEIIGIHHTSKGTEFAG